MKIKVDQQSTARQQCLPKNRKIVDTSKGNGKKKTEIEVLEIRMGEQALSLVPSKSRLKKSGRRKAKCENVEFRRLE